MAEGLTVSEARQQMVRAVGPCPWSEVARPFGASVSPSMKEERDRCLRHGASRAGLLPARSAPLSLSPFLRALGGWDVRAEGGCGCLPSCVLPGA